MLTDSQKRFLFGVDVTDEVGTRLIVSPYMNGGDLGKAVLLGVRKGDGKPMEHKLMLTPQVGLDPRLSELLSYMGVE